MRTPSGQPYTPPGFEKRMRAAEKAIDVLSRRLDRQPKIPPPVVAPGGGGGAIEQLEFYAQNGTIAVLDGSSDLAYWQITYDPPYDPSGQSSTTPTWARATGINGEISIDPGWYVASMLLDLRWGSVDETPAQGDVGMNGAGNDAPHLGYSTYASRQTGAGFGFHIVHNPGPFWSTNGGLRPEMKFYGPQSGTIDGSLTITLTRLA